MMFVIIIAILLFTFTEPTERGSDMIGHLHRKQQYDQAATRRARWPIKRRGQLPLLVAVQPSWCQIAMTGVFYHTFMVIPKHHWALGRVIAISDEIPMNTDAHGS